MKNKTLTIMMSVLAGMTALPMQAMPVFAESTEIRNTTEDDIEKAKNSAGNEAEPAAEAEENVDTKEAEE